uniref:Uncharacterized protein n=1 Tax=Rhizophora mucronata TaxID=61149 RepID=A0A2P2PKW8_RHIMU
MIPTFPIPALSSAETTTKTPRPPLPIVPSLGHFYDAALSLPNPLKPFSPKNHKAPKTSFPSSIPNRHRQINCFQTSLHA